MTSHENQGALLFVRSVADLPHALSAVNDLLARRRSPDSPRNEILGIVIDERLGARRDPEPERAEVALCESVALSGIWSLCWFDLGASSPCEHARQRRRCLLDVLPGDARILFPVFTREEVSQDLSTIWEDLKRCCPRLVVSQEPFILDRSRGGIVRLGSTGPADKMHPAA